MARGFNKNSVVLATLLSVLIIAVASVFLVSFRSTVNTTTVAIVYLLAIVLVATFLEWVAAATASIVAAFAFNFFFLEPYNTLSIEDPQNWISLFVFLAVAVTVGRLPRPQTGEGRRRSGCIKKQKPHLKRRAKPKV